MKPLLTAFTAITLLCVDGTMGVATELQHASSNIILVMLDDVG